MTEHRKAFIDPFVALCIGLVLAALFVFVLAIAGVVPKAYAASDDICVTQEEAAHAAMMQGAEVYVIEERWEVARGAGYINGGGGTAIGVTGFLVAIYSTIDLGEIYPVIDGMSCGYNRSTRADAMEFFDVVKKPDGDPA